VLFARRRDVYLQLACRVISSGSWSYAFSAPFTGQITDRIGGKNGVLIACIGAAICNILLGVLFLVQGNCPLYVEKGLFVLLYASNVLVQGFGTSAVVKINAAWYEASERGTFAGVFNIMLTSGYFLALGSGHTIIRSLGWPFIFLIPGFILAAMALAVQCHVKNFPHECSSLDEFEDLPIEAKTIAMAQIKIKPAMSKREQMSRLLKNVTFIGYLSAVFFLCWARDGLLNWMYSFFDLVREKPLTSEDNAIIGGAWTIGGFVGGILCGWVSDTIFKSDRVKPIVFGASSSISFLGVLVFFSSVFLLGNYTLLSYTVPTDLPQDIAAGAAGIMTAVGYFSTGLAGVLMGSVIESLGYGFWIVSLMVASLLAGLFTALGSYFNKNKNMLSIEDEEYIAEEFTPLASLSRSRSGRASIVGLQADFIASPHPISSSHRRLGQEESSEFVDTA